MSKLLLFSISILPLQLFASVETVKVGFYSGKPGFFVMRGPEFQAKEIGIAMSSKVSEKLLKLTSSTGSLNQMYTCKVDGELQSIGYTIFEVKSCSR